MPQGDAPPRLAVLGGGLTGAALAARILRAAPGRIRVEVVEPAAALGRGAAYGTADPAHRINVPTHRMSLWPDDPDGFTRWLSERRHLPDPASTVADGEHYVPRALFGAYAGAELARAAGAAPGCLRHRRARAVGVAPGRAGWRVTLDDGGTLEAEAVALCTGHPSPAAPCPVSAAARAHPGLALDPWRPGALAGGPPDGAVLVVGTGLTMLDVLATLDRVGHRGPVLAVSRRGLLSRPQGAFPDGFDPFDGAAPPQTARALLRTLREGLDRSAAVHGWQAVADGFKARLASLWGALPPAEQRRAVRRLLPFWEVHRFRAAPQPFALAERWRAEGRLRVERAALVGLDVAGGRLSASLHRLGGATECCSFDVAVLCTGPAGALRADPLLRALVEGGVARADGVGLGIAVDPEGRVLDAGGAAAATLRAFGPPTRGTFGEMTGEPDIVRHVARAVPGLLAALERAPAPA